MDPREVAFLASQAERLASTTKQRQPIIAGAVDGAAEVGSGGERNRDSTHFFGKFRKVCSEFQNELDSLLRIPSSLQSNNDTTTIIANDEDAKSYYATASKRNEGRLKLDSIQKNVRLLQNHVLSSSSSSTPSNLCNNDTIDIPHDNNALLQSILQTPMGDITQTDMRLLSQEITKIMKRIDEARVLICPKEKFIFKRYREALEKVGVEASAGGTSAKEASTSDTDTGNAPMAVENVSNSDNLRSTIYGGVVENQSNCTIEISSNNTIRIRDGMTAIGQLKYYASPRSFHALHPPPSSPCAHNFNEAHENQPSSSEESSSSSYLLQNLDNVTILLHGSRPSLHLQNIHKCRIYITEPTLGAVHVTNVQGSTLHCACYQLRVHDSKDVQFNVWTRSGPIIEGCTDMVFMGNYYLECEIDSINNNSRGNSSGSLESSSQAAVVGRNMYWDVKDFNWLRALRKSPNFVVIDKVVETKNEKSVLDTIRSTPVENCMQVATIIAEEDSEDEL